MLGKIQFALNYLFYFFTSGNQHSVHSPFVYNLVVHVINARRNKPVYHAFELLRSKMLRSKALVQVLPIGAGKSHGTMPLSSVVKRSAKAARYAELLERLCAWIKPQFALEIGSSVGISTMYQAAGIEQGTLYALEGNPDSLKIARHNAEQAGLNNIEFVEGLFDDTLPQLLNSLPHVDYVFFDGNHSMEPTMRYFELCLQKAHTNSVFVFDDIRWSDDMLLTWSRIKSHPAVTVTVDLYAMGIVFFRKEQEKEDFVIRF